MITARQKELLLFICDYMLTTDISPSYAEMVDGTRQTSKSGIHRLIIGLEKRGFVSRIPVLARAMEPTERGWAFFNRRNAA